MPDDRPGRQGGVPQEKGPGGGTLGVAHAPYNFVPLAARPARSLAPPSADRYHADRFTGHITLEIEALTPLYIRGTARADDVEWESTPRPDFFAPTGRPAIPGSSLRGMVRMLVEIAGGGAPRYIGDSHFVFRAVAERVASSLTRTYRARLDEQRMQAGYLVRRGRGLFIMPAQQHAGRQYWRVNREEARKVLRLPSTAWQQQPVYFRLPSADPRPAATGQRPKPAGVPLVSVFQPARGERPTDMREGWVVLSGDIQGKKHGWLIAGPDSAEGTLAVSEADEQTYRDGWSAALEEQRQQGFRLLPQGGEVVPCFYTSWRDEQQGEHLALGHTRWFRVPYAHGVHSHLPLSMRGDEQSWDLAAAMFGRVGTVEQTFRGRLFIEDATLLGDADQAFEPVGLPQILSSPKPTTFQHYLAQTAALASGSPGDLRHWDDPAAQIRGYKLYWHRPEGAGNWRDLAPTRNPAGDSQGTPIRPIRPTSRFRGRLRFENLSVEELGALLFVLDLPGGCHHRLGQGKPLGLGSVQITTQLHLGDRVARYRQLFAGAADGSLTWAAPERQPGPDKDECRGAFARWLLQAEAGQASVAADPDPIEQVWQLPRLQALRALLDWEHAPNMNATSYMRLEPKNEYSGRPVLPRALDVLGLQRPGTSPAEPAPGGRLAGPQNRPTPPAPIRPPSSPPDGKPGDVAPGGPPRPPREASQRGGSERHPVSDGAPGSSLPTAEDLRRQFQRSESSPGARPKRESAGDKAKREQREFMEQLRRDTQRER